MVGDAHPLMHVGFVYLQCFLVFVVEGNSKLIVHQEVGRLLYYPVSLRTFCSQCRTVPHSYAGVNE